MSATALTLRGVRVHNLRGIDVDIPVGKLTAITGVSGAGKSSLAFETLYAEAQRRYLQGFSAQTRQYLERFDRPDAEWIGPLPPAVAVDASSALPPRATVGSLTEIADLLRLLLARAGTVTCPRCGDELRAFEPRAVVAAAQALPPGTRFMVAFPSRPEGDVASWAAGLREEGFLRVQSGGQVRRLDETPLPELAADVPVWVLIDRLEAGRAEPQRLTDSIETAFLRGQGTMALLVDGDERVFNRRLHCPRCDLAFPDLDPRLFDRNDPLGACPECQGTGTNGRDAVMCPLCSGQRWNQFALAVRLGGQTIADVSAFPATDLADFIAALSSIDEPRPSGSDSSPRSLTVAARQEGSVLLEQIARRLAALTALDLGYLTLDRSAATLSTGEQRRVRLATVTASGLVGALYVLDEPTVGLHARDTVRLIAELRRLRDGGNTVVVVEHDRHVIAAADHIVDLGGAGADGGQVLYQGPPGGLDDDSGPTGDFWSGRSEITIPARRRQPTGQLRLSGATIHHLQDLAVEVPLGVLCAVTGVSGAGKSSLIEATLYPALCQAMKKKETRATTARVVGASQIGDVILMDQAPLPRTSRSNPATYLKFFDEIRDLFAETSEARIRNFGPGHFSFNQPGGRCETCAGQGTLTVEMQFLADVAATCPECQGRRYKSEILEIRVRSLNIAEVLDLTVREAFRFFRAQQGIERRLKFLLDVGLDYLRLGQASDTLSGGECQRLKLAGHLASSRKPRTLFILLEPSAGLHPSDLAELLACFDRLLGVGHSLIVVEHSLDVIKCADHVIDLGPEAGAAGGQVVAVGTPEAIAGVAGSWTGQALRGRG